MAYAFGRRRSNFGLFSAEDSRLTDARRLCRRYNDHVYVCFRLSSVDNETALEDICRYVAQHHGGGMSDRLSAVTSRGPGSWRAFCTIDRKALTLTGGLRQRVD